MRRVLIVILFVVTAVVLFTFVNRGIESQQRVTKFNMDREMVIQSATKILGRPPKTFDEAWIVVSAYLDAAEKGNLKDDPLKSLPR